MLLSKDKVKIRENKAFGENLGAFGHGQRNNPATIFQGSTETSIIEKLPKLNQAQLESIERRIDTYIDDNEVAARKGDCTI